MKELIKQWVEEELNGDFRQFTNQGTNCLSWSVILNRWSNEWIHSLTFMDMITDLYPLMISKDTESSKWNLWKFKLREITDETHTYLYYATALGKCPNCLWR